MPDVDTIIASALASALDELCREQAHRRQAHTWPGMVALTTDEIDAVIDRLAEIERLRADISRIKCPPNPSDHSMTEAEQGEFQSAMVDLLDCSTADAWMIGSLAEAWMLGREYAANRHEPHPTEPGVERGEGGTHD